jgi:hypothetical protein
MGVEVFARCAIITDGDDDSIDVCDNCGREWKRQMLHEIEHLLSRVDPGGVMPSGECPDPECGALCYPKGLKNKESKEWMLQAAWIYPKDDARVLPLLLKELTAHFGEHCRVWQNERHLKGGEYPQYLCSADLRGIGGDVCHLWRDGQTWWPMAGDYSCKDEEMAELILRKYILEFSKE